MTDAVAAVIAVCTRIARSGFFHLPYSTSTWQWASGTKPACNPSASGRRSGRAVPIASSIGRSVPPSQLGEFR